MPILKFFTNNKAEIVNNIENFPTILAREKVDSKACRELLMRCTRGQTELFVQLAPVFKCLTNTKDVETTPTQHGEERGDCQRLQECFGQPAGERKEH